MECPRNADGTYDLSVVIAWHEKRLLAEQEKAAPHHAPGRLGGARTLPRREGPALARLERLTREGTLLERSFVHTLLVNTAQVIRDAGIRLGETYGPNAQNILNEALEVLRRRMVELVRRRASEDAVDWEPNTDTSDAP